MKSKKLLKLIPDEYKIGITDFGGITWGFDIDYHNSFGISLYSGSLVN